MNATTKAPMKSLRMSFVLMALALAPTAWAQQSPPLTANVEQQMTPEQFKAAGLDKLSSQELAALNAWLQHKVVQETAKAVETAKEEGRKEVVEKSRGFFDFGTAEQRREIGTAARGVAIACDRLGRAAEFVGRQRVLRVDEQVDSVFVHRLEHDQPQDRLHLQVADADRIGPAQRGFIDRMAGARHPFAQRLAGRQALGDRWAPGLEGLGDAAAILGRQQPVIARIDVCLEIDDGHAAPLALATPRYHPGGGVAWMVTVVQPLPCQR